MLINAGKRIILRLSHGFRSLYYISGKYPILVLWAFNLVICEYVVHRLYLRTCLWPAGDESFHRESGIKVYTPFTRID